MRDLDEPNETGRALSQSRGTLHCHKVLLGLPHATIVPHTQQAFCESNSS